VTPRAWLILIVGIAAVIEDLGWRRISNWTSGGALAGGFIVHFADKGWPGLGRSFLGAVIGFGVFLIFYLLGGMAIRTIFRQSRSWMGVAGPGASVAEAKSGESIPYAPALTVGAWLALISEM